MKQAVFLCAVWGVIFGIFVRSIFFIHLNVELLLLMLSLALVVFIIKKNWSENFPSSLSLVSLIFVASASLGMLRYAWFVSDVGDARFRLRENAQVVLEGVVVKEPADKSASRELVVRADLLNGESVTPTRVLVLDDAYSRREYGDRVRVKGKLQKPSKILSENGQQFDYASYLAKEKIFYQISFARVELVSPGHGSVFKSQVLRVKSAFVHSLDRSLPYLEAKLGAGLVVAGKHALPKEVQDEFVRTGTVQVVVLSGYNLTVIASLVFALLAWLPLRVRAGASATLIVIFVVAAGAGAALIRAALMVFVSLLGAVLRREYRAGRALLASAFFMLIHNPMLLVFDPSFQLSFIATAGLIYVTPLVRPRLKFLSDTSAVKDIAASTIATQIFVTPFVLYLTGTLSIVALPANLLVTFLVPLAMLASFITGIFGLMSELLGVVSGFAAYVILASVLQIVHIFSCIPGSSLSISHVPLAAVALVYASYAVAIWRFFRRETAELKNFLR